MDDLTVQRIKDAADIVDVVGEFVHLEKKGKEYQGLCPFHDDRHMGSFSVSPQKQMYMCFACGAGGDALSFVMRVKNINYQEALLWLAAMKVQSDTGQWFAKLHQSLSRCQWKTRGQRFRFPSSS